MLYSVALPHLILWKVIAQCMYLFYLKKKEEQSPFSFSHAEVASLYFPKMMRPTSAPSPFNIVIYSFSSSSSFLLERGGVKIVNLSYHNFGALTAHCHRSAIKSQRVANVKRVHHTILLLKRKYIYTHNFICTHLSQYIVYNIFITNRCLQISHNIHQHKNLSGEYQICKHF